GVMIAHGMLAVPVAFLVISATLKGFDQNLERAAMSSGAGPFRTFVHVTLPVLRPGMLVGALFAFLSSFNEAVVSIFIGGRGDVYPVNPRYESLLGRRCYPSVADLPRGVDVLAFCVNHARVLEHMQPAADRGVGAAVIFDGGFAEAGAEGRARQDAIAAICREASIALCGPNCMGVISPHVPSLVYIQALHDPSRLAGNAGL